MQEGREKEQCRRMWFGAEIYSSRGSNPIGGGSDELPRTFWWTESNSKAVAIFYGGEQNPTWSGENIWESDSDTIRRANASCFSRSR